MRTGGNNGTPSVVDSVVVRVALTASPVTAFLASAVGSVVVEVFAEH